MSYRTIGWKFVSKNEATIYFEMCDDNEQFEIFYNNIEDREHSVMFDKDDIPDLINLLYLIQEA